MTPASRSRASPPDHGFHVAPSPCHGGIIGFPLAGAVYSQCQRALAPSCDGPVVIRVLPPPLVKVFVVLHLSYIQVTVSGYWTPTPNWSRGGRGVCPLLGTPPSHNLKIRRCNLPITKRILDNHPKNTKKLHRHNLLPRRASAWRRAPSSLLAPRTPKGAVHAKCTTPSSNH